SSFWNWASRHQGKPNDCARPSAASTSKKTMTSHAARHVELIRKPLINRLLTELRRRVIPRLAEDKLLREQQAVEQQFVCPVRLTAVLGAEAEQDKVRSEEHTSELQSRGHLVCRLLLEKKNMKHPGLTA